MILAMTKDMERFIKNCTTRTVLIRRWYSEREGILLDKRTFRRYCEEAGIQLTIRIAGKRRTKHKFTPSDILKWKQTHGTPEL